MVSLPQSARSSTPGDRKVISRIERIVEGFGTPCEVVFANGSSIRVGTAPPKFRVIIHDDRVLRRSFDEFALGEAFVRGDFDIEGDMMSFFDIRARLKRAVGFVPLLQFWGSLLFLAPTQVNRKAIQHHYEFGEDFFFALMDKTYHVYSHGFFAADDEPLERAIERKLEVMYNWAELKPGMRVLDIGAGWGGVTRYLGPRGVHTTSLTLAQDSLQHISTLLKTTGYPGEVYLQDFLTHRASKPYDAIVILGVIEHIPYYRKFFQQAWDLLKPGGLIYMDASADIEKFAVSRFIRHFIYPGTHSYMCLQDVLQEQLYHGFLPRHVENDDHNYSLTMRDWALNFESNKDMIIKRWGREVYRAFWLYLWSGAYAFENHVLQAYHLVAQRSAERGPRPGLLRRTYNFVREQF